MGFIMATGPTDWEKQNKDKAASAFDKARQQQQPEKEKTGSQQVKETAPRMDGPKPPGHVREAVDRQAHQTKMARDDKAALRNDRAHELRQGAMERRGQEQQREQSKGEKER